MIVKGPLWPPFLNFGNLPIGSSRSILKQLITRNNLGVRTQDLSIKSHYTSPIACNNSTQEQGFEPATDFLRDVNAFLSGFEEWDQLCDLFADPLGLKVTGFLRDLKFRILIVKVQKEAMDLHWWSHRSQGIEPHNNLELTERQSYRDLVRLGDLSPTIT